MTAGQMVYEALKMFTIARFAPSRPLAWPQEPLAHRSDFGLAGCAFLMWECATGQSPHPCVSRIAGGRGQVAGGVNKRRRQSITESDGRGRPDVLTARIIERS